ncbi:MAG: putative N-acetylneuraminate synthase [Acidobacteria bacterium]|nr:putative N-acetylneuraminate synthase [Acidobacteriota bacterium]
MEQMEKRVIDLNGRLVGEGQPVYFIAEIGLNHNGDLNLAKQLIDVAKGAGCDAVKFQKRTPEKCVPAEMRDRMRETPWGYITYLDYRHKIEFGYEEFQEIDRYCQAVGIDWFASCWDVDSVDFISQFDVPCFKVASATLTHRVLLERLRASGRPIILSTGMSTMEEIRAAVNTLDQNKLLLAHSTSTYPCKNEELNLRVIAALYEEFDCPIGYSGHEVGLATTVAAVALGASFIERHITLNRAMWGSDQSASVEPQGLARLIKDIRNVDRAMGDGIKRVYESEQPAMQRLRLHDNLIN